MQTRQKQVRFVCHHSDTSDNLLLCIPTITFWVLIFVNSVPLCFVLLESGQFKCSELKSGHLLYGLEKLPLKRKISVTLFTRPAEMFTPIWCGYRCDTLSRDKISSVYNGASEVKNNYFFIPFDVLLYQMSPKLHLMKTKLYVNAIALL